MNAIIISDLHLGSDNCQAKLLNIFLEEILHKEIVTELLILNGDVFDSIDFRRLKKTHWKVLSNIRHLSDKIKVLWICGNHDSPADTISHLIGVEIEDRYILESKDKNIFITHGDVYDNFINNHPIITNVADFIYNILQKIDPKHYVARMAKKSSKTFLRCSNEIKKCSLEEAKKNHCNVAICGHTHRSEVSPEGNMTYYNSGCWTELPCSYIIINDGLIELKGIDNEIHRKDI